METIKELASKGIITEDMKIVAEDEGVSPEFVREGIENGTIVITKNIKRKNIKPVGVGKGMRVKVNVNLGTSADKIDYEDEMCKATVAMSNGADTIMDLSTGGKIDELRRDLIKEIPMAIGTVPVYQAAVEGERQGKRIEDLTKEDFFNGIKKHAEDGVDYMTVHVGVSQVVAERLNNSPRYMDVVSRGGSILLSWMRYNKKENPLFEYFDELIDIAKEYDVTLSLGDGIRPGAVIDASDGPQIQELIILGELTQRAWDKGVQVIIEGPGHVPMDQIAANMIMEKSLCHGAPFYVLGPLVTDIAPGYDHITAAIGGAIAGMAGADFLCYVTPAEHLRLPDVQDVKDGVIASRIAAHAVDLARGNKKAWEWDIKMAEYRKNLKWGEQIKISIDPEKAKEYRESIPIIVPETCTMCGELCAIKVSRDSRNDTENTVKVQKV